MIWRSSNPQNWEQSRLLLLISAHISLNGTQTSPGIVNYSNSLYICYIWGLFNNGKNFFNFCLFLRGFWHLRSVNHTLDGFWKTVNSYLTSHVIGEGINRTSLCHGAVLVFSSKLVGATSAIFSFRSNWMAEISAYISFRISFFMATKNSSTSACMESRSVEKEAWMS